MMNLTNCLEGVAMKLDAEKQLEKKGREWTIGLLKESARAIAELDSGLTWCDDTLEFSGKVEQYEKVLSEINKTTVLLTGAIKEELGYLSKIDNAINMCEELFVEGGNFDPDVIRAENKTIEGLVDLREEYKRNIIPRLNDAVQEGHYDNLSESDKKSMVFIYSLSERSKENRLEWNELTKEQIKQVTQTYRAIRSAEDGTPEEDVDVSNVESCTFYLTESGYIEVLV